MKAGMKKFERGEYGYLSWKKKNEFLHVMFLILASVAIFLLGYFTTKPIHPDNPTVNLFTVIAIVFVLPITKEFISFVILMSFRTTSAEARANIKKLEESSKEDITVFYDAVFTMAEKVNHLDYIVVTDRSVLGFSARPKDNCAKLNEIIKTELSRRGFNSHVFVSNDESAVLKKLENDIDCVSDTDRKGKDRHSEVAEAIKLYIM